VRVMRERALCPDPSRFSGRGRNLEESMRAGFL